MRDNVERWLIHEGLAFTDIKTDENTFCIRIRHAGRSGVPVEVFEPKAQPGILGVGCKVIMKNNQTLRYLAHTQKEKENFEEKVAQYCYSIRAINKNVTEEGKRKIGVYVVLDKKEDITQGGVIDAINSAAEKYDDVSRFLLKTF